MPFYLRKSVKAGPFRFNFSQGGIGISAGVKGLRIGTGPRGHYIHAGRGGLYYRASIPGKSERKYRSSGVGLDPKPRSPQPSTDSDIDMIAVSSGDVLEMEESRFSYLLNELNARQESLRMSATLGCIGLGIATLALYSAGAGGLAIGGLFAIVAYAVGGWLDSYQRCEVLMYDLDAEVELAYAKVTETFDGLIACQKKWHVDAGGVVNNIHAWKRNAGASHVLNKRPTVFSYSLPAVVKANITPPSIVSGKETLYFLPDFLLVVHGSKVGAVAYENLVIRGQLSNFIEDGAVPSDTRILYHTWAHPNKNGGPDRRFANNYQIPVCEYESVHFTSSNGLNELLQVSRAGFVDPFVKAIAGLAAVNGSGGVGHGLPQVGQSS